MMTGRSVHIAALVLAALMAMGDRSPLFAAEQPKKVQVKVTADKLDHDRARDIYTAEGRVRIEQQHLRLEADKVVLNNGTGEAVADGNVYLRDNGDTVLADHLEVNLNTGAGVITNGRLYKAKENFHLKGDRIERRSETVYHIENGVFTTCDEGEWYLRARTIDLDMDKYATGSEVSFNMAGLPMVYTPYLLFPVKRQSGLLIPMVGYSSTDGFLMKNQVFWAISDYQDMTFISDYRYRTGHGTGIEYRYVNSQDSAGRAFYNYFDTFHSGINRWELQFQHREEFAEDLSFRADINLVSDENYYRDLEKKLEPRARPYLDSNAFYVERWNTASLYLLGQYSTDLTGTNERTIQKVPELRYTIFGEPLGRIGYFRFEGSATNFSSKAGSNILRADFKPELMTVLSGYGLSLTPRAGARATFYDQGATTIEPVERKYVYAGADLNARFSRVYGEDVESGIGRVRHSIEPTISYSYIPRIEQGDIPHLDGVDEAQEENAVTFALINRLTARYKEGASLRTFDLMVFRLSEKYDLAQARNKTLTNAQPRSEVKGELAVRTPKLLTVSANGAYNTYTHKLTSSSESITVKGGVVQVDLSHRYLHDPRTQFLIGGLGLKLEKWQINAQHWRDVENRETTQKEYKIQYASQCWGVGASYAAKPGERQYLFMLDLKGLGGVKL
ncbi:MAG: LPS-assembly protein LptD [Nitrospirota bacterium]